ncbi:MAG: hypothetical protein ABW106_09720 [Steroidobacteraceae bacterium]
MTSKKSNRMTGVLAIGLTLAGIGSASAEGWYTGSVGRVQLNSAGQIMVWLQGSNNECGSTRVDYVNANDATGRSILGAILAWQAQGKVLSFYITNCSGARGMFSDVADPG